MISNKSWGRISTLAIILGLALAVSTAHAQNGPTSGMYQIVSGRFIACCGIAGPVIEPLPSSYLAFVELTVDRQRHLAQMTFLGQDMRTIPVIPAEHPCSGFTCMFTNGTAFADRIEFGEVTPPTDPSQLYLSYVVSNSTDTLQINGEVIMPCRWCSDCFVQFTQTNVIAIAMPVATIRVSEVEVAWNTVSNRTYQVQYRSSLTTNVWTDLGSPLTGTGPTNSITDKVPLGEPQRFYRVLKLP